MCFYFLMLFGRDCLCLIRRRRRKVEVESDLVRRLSTCSIRFLHTYITCIPPLFLKQAFVRQILKNPPGSHHIQPDRVEIVLLPRMQEKEGRRRRRRKDKTGVEGADESRIESTKFGI